MSFFGKYKPPTGHPADDQFPARQAQAANDPSAANQAGPNNGQGTHQPNQPNQSKTAVSNKTHKVNNHDQDDNTLYRDELAEILVDRVRTSDLPHITKLIEEGKLEFSLNLSKGIVDHIFEIIRDELTAGRDVRIKKVGTLYNVTAESRRNNLTGGTTPQRRRVKWRAGNAFTRTINGLPAKTYGKSYGKAKGKPKPDLGQENSDPSETDE